MNSSQNETLAHVAQTVSCSSHRLTDLMSCCTWDTVLVYALLKGMKLCNELVLKRKATPTKTGQ